MMLRRVGPKGPPHQRLIGGSKSVGAGRHHGAGGQVRATGEPHPLLLLLCLCACVCGAVAWQRGCPHVGSHAVNRFTQVCAKVRPQVGSTASAAGRGERRGGVECRS